MEQYMSPCGKLKVMELVGVEGKILDTKTRATVEVTETPNTFPNGTGFISTIISHSCIVSSTDVSGLSLGIISALLIMLCTDCDLPEFQTTNLQRSPIHF